MTTTVNTSGILFPDATTQTTAFTSSSAVTSLVAGTNISVSGAHGAITVASTGQVKVQRFTSGGTYTPTSGINYAIVEGVGGGGGGGGVFNCSGAGGGGAGGYFKVYFTAAQLGASQSITIGSGGSGGASGGGTGGNGGTTSFGSLASAGGGTGGACSGQNAVTYGGAGGSSTVSSGTTILSITGQYGGGAGQNNFAFGAMGAPTPIGNPGMGYWAFKPDFGGGAGGAASGYGSGGGAACSSCAGAFAGGAGAPGIIIVYEYII